MVALPLENVLPPKLGGIFWPVKLTTAVVIAYDRGHRQPVITLTEFSWLTDQVSNTFESVAWKSLYLLTWREAVDMSVPWGVYVLDVMYTQLKKFSIAVQKNSTGYGKSSAIPSYTLRSPLLDRHLLKFVCISLSVRNIFCDYKLKACYGH